MVGILQGFVNDVNVEIQKNYSFFLPEGERNLAEGYLRNSPAINNHFHHHAIAFKSNHTW